MTELTVMALIIICLAGWWASMIFNVVTTEYREEEKTDSVFIWVYGLAFVIACYGLYGLIPA